MVTILLFVFALAAVALNFVAHKYADVLQEDAAALNAPAIAEPAPAYVLTPAEIAA